ncbi:MAG: Ldh family oxidoreductase [Rhodothermales bacterium]
MEPIPVKTYASEQLREFCRRVFEHLDVPDADARQAADVLALADLRGIDSHGVARLKTYYDLLRNGRINPKPRVQVVRHTLSTATVDGDNGLGLVVAPKANRIAIAKAEQSGSGWVSVFNTNHFGIAGYYVLEALEHDVIGWAMTNTTKIVAPLWGREKMLGTNPLAIAFPGREEPPVVIDMSTSTVPFGAIEIAQRKGKAIPEGWAIDERGETTTDPNEMIAGGALLPLGSTREMGGHKGYCLGAMVDILSCVLSGANWGPFAPPFALGQALPDREVGKGIGHFFGALRIAGFIDPDEFKRQMDDWVRTFRRTDPAPGTHGPLIPGDPEREAHSVREREGIPVLMPVVEALRLIARETGIPLD